MERIRPIKYRPDWNNIPVDWLISKMELYRAPGSSDLNEEFESTAAERTNTKIVRIPPQHTNWEELNKVFRIFDFGCMDYLSFIELPANVGYPSHVDKLRSCNINFVRPTTDGTPVSPIKFGERVYEWDRFFMDPSVHHEVPASSSTRFTMMCTYLNTPYDKILKYLQRDGWV
tara:strand:- start:5560 stop:6078 length:519 start_codon:yes stop_codon:yes gene_type:complete